SGERVAVNVSSIQLHRGDFVATIESALSKSGLHPSRLELEITESAFLSEGEATLRILRKLRAMGVRIALDDFGTGYSSLSYLNTFPLDKIKIDRSFLRDIDKDARSLGLLRGVLRLSRELGLGVVVEGIETLQQLNTVSEGGYVDEVQGYLFSPAMSPEAVRAILNEAGNALPRVA